MTLLEYLIFSNLYLLLFWLVYAIFLKGSTYFKQVRIYISLSLILGLVLPFIHHLLVEAFTSPSIIDFKSIVGLPEVRISYGEPSQPLAPMTETRSGPDLKTIIAFIITGGSILSILSYFWRHNKLMKLILGGSREVKIEDSVTIHYSEKVDVPFLYHRRIVLPAGMSWEEEKLAIAHELSHHRLRHQADHLLSCALQPFYWFNPFFYLFRQAMVLNHEYQVDNELLKEVNSESYQMMLIRFSVGKQTFGFANGFSASKLKNRIKMIHINNQKGRLRLIAAVPVIIGMVLLLALSCVTGEQDGSRNNTPVQEGLDNTASDNNSSVKGAQEIESLVSGTDNSLLPMIRVFYDQNPEFSSADEVIVVLMNRYGKIMVSGEVIESRAVSESVRKAFLEILDSDELEKLLASSPTVIPDQDIRVIMQKDVQTDSTKFSLLLHEVTRGLDLATRELSKKIFHTEYTDLPKEKKLLLQKIAYAEIYMLPNKAIGQSSD